MLPLVQAESGGLARLWWLFAGRGSRCSPAFALWERRVVRRGGDPLLDPRLVTQTPGYATGAALGTVYFIGFSGIWLVFALFFQTGLGWTPLQSGLAVTPFALGSAVSAVFGGRLVDRYGRRLTVIGLTGVLVGIGAAAVVLRFAPTGSVGWAVAPALLLGGHRRRPRDLAERDDDLARRAGADGGLGGRGAADRAALRRGDRHGHPARAVLPGAVVDGERLPGRDRRGTRRRGGRGGRWRW